MFEKVLIANRGAIACRIMRTLRRIGVKSVAVYTDADALSRHVVEADEAFCIGSGVAADSYLRVDKILEIAQQAGVQAIHPGYGFLSENADFAEQCAANNICFIGPSPQQMRTFGLKHTARALAKQNQVPLLPGTDLLDSLDEALHAAAHVGYPIMLKSTAGGGGIGIRLCWNKDELIDAYDTVKYLAQNNFKDAGLFLEKFVENGRHIEVQIFGDGQGEVIALGERDCSMQRRNQKVIEETPAPGLTPGLRQALLDAAVRLGKSVNYQSAGTVEYIFDASSGEFYFLEVNTRLQVEHGVTEEVTGIDLVEWMVQQAAGDLPPLNSFKIEASGSSIQVRIYAENPAKDFQPSSGTLTAATFSSAARIETWVERGVAVSPFYDPMLAKIIVHEPKRAQAITSLLNALDTTMLYGIETNLDYLKQVLCCTAFRESQYNTNFLNGFHYAAQTIDVLSPGVQTTIQDYPGRLGYWHIGVPPSGPMDSYAFRLANRLVDNAEDKAGLEITFVGPTLKFNNDSIIAITGAPIDVRLDGESLSLWQSHDIKAGSLLQFGKISHHGCRAYLAIQGGFQVADYLGSKSTFTLGQFGGHAGRVLRSGDVLHMQAKQGHTHSLLQQELIPDYTDSWEIGVLYGPHGAPDFFTDEDIHHFFTTAWNVHHNSSRTGVRLLGPKPQWARSDGGEAGLHPSNIHDNAYAVGTVDFTGDMPVILGPDGPSLGGFVCPATIVQAELWKLGQLKPGDAVRFRPLSMEQAMALEKRQNESILYLRPAKATPAQSGTDNLPLGSPVLYTIPESAQSVQVIYRQSGDNYLLVEYGPLILDLNLRFRAHALMNWIQKALDSGDLNGILDLTPGIRSLQIHFDSQVLARRQLLDFLIAVESQLPSIEEMTVSTRIVHLPLSWDDVATRLAIEKYTQSVRKDAPWCPSNIEFIRRINGLDSVEEVKRILFEASYLVMGLGDVYLGAPVATPVDPRHRLVTTKYNPARTWTPENAVGIGGAYLCVYGMEGPGGYQFVGRTVQMWNRYRQTSDFKDGKPWLLRFFDQIRFYPVSESELLALRKDFITGQFKLRVEETTFSLKEHHRFLQQNSASIKAFKTRQQAAFEAERERWKLSGQAEDYVSEDSLEESDTQSELDMPAGACAIGSHITGTVWKLLVKEGQSVTAGDSLVVIESMKMEFSVDATVNGTVQQIACKEGGYVSTGQMLLIIQADD
ncbi:urea carboxylase [Nitrosomonas cryotolerans]|uniref:Urea carboxylase n=1 Tax=Nitrosomonas cryotolerans ATCC 49181 TaxID=1131553 RepID=A0A1N6G2C6_9PROT|nr:urea carboxylase [Nitrosomonas cryotolerans]SFQ07896.1 urea carboxylase [Nitrosomonas cryotolerans]SIO01716.1 urea carboxylase [Nitrosomonas cryotolerans ATCC 49181]